MDYSKKIAELKASKAELVTQADAARTRASWMS